MRSELLEYWGLVDPFNPFYVSLVIGARATWGQALQVVSMRGNGVGAAGQRISYPILRGFYRGLNIKEFLVSSYGVRKGLVDTGLRTADAGYLTRRIVCVAQGVYVKESDCGGKDCINLDDFVGRYGIPGFSVSERLLGRFLGRAVLDDKGEEVLLPGNTLITEKVLGLIEGMEMKKLFVRTLLTCGVLVAVCRLCYGCDLSTSRLVDLGVAVGVIAGQSIGEPSTQLIMRTFHQGGVVGIYKPLNFPEIVQIKKHKQNNKKVLKSSMGISPLSGVLKYSVSRQGGVIIRQENGRSALKLRKPVVLSILNEDEGQVVKSFVPAGATLLVPSNQSVKYGSFIYQLDRTPSARKKSKKKGRGRRDHHLIRLSEEEGKLFFDFPVSKLGRTGFVALANGTAWILRRQYYGVENVQILNRSVGDKISGRVVIGYSQILNTL